jgi:hypothetical protein
MSLLMKCPVLMGATTVTRGGGIAGGFDIKNGGIIIRGLT